MTIIEHIKGKNSMKHLFKAGIAFISLTLVGCNLHTPTAVTQQPFQIHEEVMTHDVLLADVDDAFIDGLAKHYAKHGGSTMDLILTYDPKSYRNTAMNASNNLADVAQKLRRHGVIDVDASVMPIKSQGDSAHLLVSYTAVTASVPKECENMLSGMDGSAVEADRDYKLGCSIKSMTARQVAKPADLAGRELADHETDGRSATNIVDRYRSGAPNASLDGQSATQ